MPIWAYILIFLLGVFIVVEATERFVEGLLGSSLTLGVSAFALGVIFGGFDAENLAAGVAAGLKDLPGVSMGTVIGSGIFLLTVAVGLCGVLAPLNLRLPGRFVLLTFLSPIPLLMAMGDGIISRREGLMLFLISIALIAYITKASQREMLLKKGEVDEMVEERSARPAWFFPALMVGGVIAIAMGAELAARGAKGIVTGLGISDTRFGMIFVAGSVSLEEIVRGLIPAYRGYPEIAVGNLLGTILFFVTFNVGVIALVRPLRIEAEVTLFYWPFLMAVLALVSIFLMRRRIGRWEGGTLLAGYAIYLMLNWLR